jgi:hypothetical protein
VIVTWCSTEAVEDDCLPPCRAAALVEEGHAVYLVPGQTYNVVEMEINSLNDTLVRIQSAYSTKGAEAVGIELAQEIADSAKPFTFMGYTDTRGLSFQGKDEVCF